ncbi:hypothetical protein D1872_250930 [compost metagenome]
MRHPQETGYWHGNGVLLPVHDGSEALRPRCLPACMQYERMEIRDQSAHKHRLLLAQPADLRSFPRSAVPSDRPACLVLLPGLEAFEPMNSPVHSAPDTSDADVQTPMPPDPAYTPPAPQTADGSSDGTEMHKRCH